MNDFPFIIEGINASIFRYKQDFCNINKGKNPFEHDYKERQKRIITKIVNDKKIKIFDENIKINLSTPEERKAYRDAETQYVSARLLEDYGEKTAQEYLNKKKGNN